MINWIKNIFSRKITHDYFAKTEGKILYVDRSPSEKEKEQFKKVNNLGVSEIKIGDKFEGWACSYFFKDQICTAIKDELIYGTTTLAVFKKEYIKLT